ncbi:hypothetical protein [Enterococcus faecalis]|uniref:hypothetical protein n=1 Tax=Enterococcus TaxID=1350 RepID=UPI0029356FAD|nr:hypothetical protein [Enterococcus faecalis]MDV2499612.1 hypothetical protein [Enterococcus faecalis]
MIEYFIKYVFPFAVGYLPMQAAMSIFEHKILKNQKYRWWTKLLILIALAVTAILVMFMIAKILYITDIW